MEGVNLLRDGVKVTYLNWHDPERGISKCGPPPVIPGECFEQVINELCKIKPLQLETLLLGCGTETHDKEYMEFGCGWDLPVWKYSSPFNASNYTIFHSPRRSSPWLT